MNDPDYIPPRDWTPLLFAAVFCAVYFTGEIRGYIVNSFGLWWNIEKAIAVTVVGWLLMTAVRAGNALALYLADIIREWLRIRLEIRESGDGHGV